MFLEESARGASLRARRRPKLSGVLFDDALQTLLGPRPLLEEVLVAHVEHVRERLAFEAEPLRGARDAARFQLKGLLYQPRLQLVDGAVEAEVLVVELHPR